MSADALAGPGKAERVLRLDRLSVSFASDAGAVRSVREAGFEVRPGEIVAVVGESGSGKTVTSRALLGLLPSTAAVTGSATLDGEELTSLHGEAMRQIRGRRIAMIFQEPATSLDPVRTVGRQVCEALHAHAKISRRAAKARAVELLELVGIPDAAKRVRSYPHQLSGGQRQRVSLARALVLGPDLLVADEPTSAPDVSVQATVLDLFRDLQQEMGFACLFISHDLAVVDLVAHDVAVMCDGKLVEVGTTAEVLGHPQHQYTRALLAAVPVPDPAEQAVRRKARAQLLASRAGGGF